MNGFMGVGMMNMASGGMFGGVQQNAMMNNNGATQQYNPYPQQGGHNVPTHPGVVVSAPANAEELDDNSNNTMAFCPNCGTKNSGSNFCGNCGHKLVK